MILNWKRLLKQANNKINNNKKKVLMMIALRIFKILQMKMKAHFQNKLTIKNHNLKINNLLDKEFNSKNKMFLQIMINLTLIQWMLNIDLLY